MLSLGNAELGVKLYLSIALAADRLPVATEETSWSDVLSQVSRELVSQAFQLHEAEILELRAQQRCIVCMIGTLLGCGSLDVAAYESLITKVAQYAAKLMKKRDQCQMVGLCSHLFYVITNTVSHSRRIQLHRYADLTTQA